jgi:SPP1 family predicted phage head-tail adaptor
MRAGELRHRVSLQTNGGTSVDAYGARAQSWTTTVTVWAAVEPLHGNELFRAQQVQAEATSRIRLRGGVTLTPQSRILFGARVFEVLSVQNLDERGQELQAICKELI